MARLTDVLERRRLVRLTEQLAQELRVQLGIMYSTDSVEDVELWRRAARRAGRQLGICIRTGVSRDGTRVWASEGP